MCVRARMYVRARAWLCERVCVRTRVRVFSENNCKKLPVLEGKALEKPGYPELNCPTLRIEPRSHREEARELTPQPASRREVQC